MFCFYFLEYQGTNAVYTPWEGNVAQAIAAGIRAIKNEEIPCVSVGGCDVKIRELSFINLQQLGIFDSWNKYGIGSLPVEGSAFLVLEEEQRVLKRGSRIYGRIGDYKFGSLCRKVNLPDIVHSIIDELNIKDPLTQLSQLASYFNIL